MQNLPLSSRDLRPTPLEPPADLPDLLKAVRQRTPARILVGRAGPAYRTATQLELRQDHAAAVDAVHAELQVEQALGPNLVAERGLFEVQTRAASKIEFLMRPDLGRKLCDSARDTIAQRCPKGID